jgi:integrase
MSIWKEKATKAWSYQFQFANKAYGARGFKTRRDAEAARVKRREEVKAQVQADLKAAKTDTGFKTIAYDYLDFAKRKYVKDVYLRKANVCKRFAKALPQAEFPIDQITPRHVHDYLTSLEGNSIYNEHRQELSALFNWTKRIYSAQLPFLINPCVGVEPMTHVTKEKEIPTQKEILRMIAAANPGDDRDTFLTCLYTLDRIDEILRLRWHEDVNFEKRYVVLWTRKRKDGAYQPDVLPMNDDLYDVLKKRWENRKQDKWVFWNPIANEGKGDRYKERPKMMWTICKRAGCPPIGTRRVKRSPGQIRAFEKKNKRPIREDERIMTLPKYYGFHSIRHFMASYLMDEHKVSLKTVSGLLRHKAVRTTEIYLHSVDSSALAATDKIRGVFTLKMSEPLRSPATKETEKEKGAAV